MQRIVVVVPCYNEAGRLKAEALLQAAHSSPGLSFVLVNDGSTDATGEQLAALREQNPRAFDVVSLPQNQGKAEAVRQGMLRAFEHSPDLVGYFDADLATPLTEIAPMAAPLPPPAMAPIIAPKSAPPPTYFPVLSLAPTPCRLSSSRSAVLTR